MSIKNCNSKLIFIPATLSLTPTFWHFFSKMWIYICVAFKMSGNTIHLLQKIDYEDTSITAYLLSNGDASPS